MNYSYSNFNYRDHHWFSSIEEEFDKYIVYVHSMSREVFEIVPRKIDNKQVLIHFVQYRDFDPNSIANYVYTLNQVEEKTDLKKVITNLKKDCSSSILEEIFYEVHDGDNSVTNQSWKHPKIREQLEKLYNEYGFELMYNNIDY